jgi:hypothetical protein
VASDRLRTPAGYFPLSAPSVPYVLYRWFFRDRNFRRIQAVSPGALIQGEALIRVTA